MKLDFLRKIPIAIVSLLVSSTAFAAMDMDSRVTSLERQMPQVRTDTAMGNCGCTTAIARPEVRGCGCHSWYLTLDLLYWHAKVGGTEYAYSDQDPIGALPVKGRTKDMDFSWDWGLRVGLGYNFDHDGWDANFQYTWYDTSGSDSTSAGLNSSTIPLKGSSGIVATTTNPDHRFVFCHSAKSQYDLNYSAVDLELGRAYFVSCKLSFRPHWGLKSAWIDQEQIVRYTGKPQNDNELGLGINTVHIKDTCDFWGLGPRTGVQSKWHLGCGFSIFGNVSGAILFGYFDVDHKEKWTGNPSNRIRLNANRHAFSPTTQFQLGLRYDRYVNERKQHIGIGLGFEGQYWWRQNQMLKIDDAQVLKYERYSEDVSMHGITLDVKFDF